MKTLYAPTEDFIKGEHTTLTASVSGGTGISLDVENTSGIATGSFIAVGYEGSETCELTRVTSVTDATHVVLDSLLFNHANGEHIRVYRYNARKFYGSTAGVIWNELTASGSPKAIEVDDPQGTVLEYTGSDGYLYFKATYYNTATGEETDPNEAGATSADQSSHCASLYDIRVAAGFIGNTYYTDSRIEDKRREAEAEINSVLSAVYTLPLTYVSDYVQNIATMLAAGKILFQEYPESETGAKMLGEARALLVKITKGEVLLFDENMVELPRVLGSVTVPKGGPQTDEDRAFRRSMMF